MEVTVYACINRLVERGSGKVVALWPQHAFEELLPAECPANGSPFGKDRVEIRSHRIKVPIGSELAPTRNKFEAWLMLRVAGGVAYHPAEVLRMARGGERGFSLLPAQIPQSADA